MSNKFRSFLPGKLELWSLVFIAGAILVLGNITLFLTYYGLSGSSNLLNEQLSHRVKSGLEVVDSFSITPTVVTFLTWVIAGIIVLSLGHAIANMSQTIKFEREVSSNSYIHPQNFRRGTYWRNIVVGTVWSFILLVCLAAGILLYLAFVIPISYSYTQQFLLTLHLRDVPYMLLGIFIMFTGTLLLYLLGKATYVHYRLSQN